MRGIYFNALKEMCINLSALEKLQKVLSKFGYSENFIIRDNDKIDDSLFLEICDELRRGLKLSSEDFYSIYGDYYVSYTYKKYKKLFNIANNTYEFLLKISDFHKKLLNKINENSSFHFHIQLKDDAIHCKIKPIINTSFTSSLIKSIGRIYNELPFVEYKDNDTFIIKI
ncbi:MAG: heme NO-binding domain-containing protein [Deferribacterota bacterium]|nr:heme NO-binding domain-containing protein [Deferribacterota bacterium]